MVMLHLCVGLSFGNTSRRLLAIEEHGNFLECRTPCLYEEEIDDKALDDQTVTSQYYVVDMGGTTYSAT